MGYLFSFVITAFPALMLRVLSCAHLTIFSKCCAATVSFLRIKVTRADVAVRVGSRVVAIQVEQAIIQVAVIVAANVQDTGPFDTVTPFSIV